MGNSLNACIECNRRNARKDLSILLAGLDNAGKTQTVGLLAGSNVLSEAPTVGFHPVHLHYRNRKINLHDVGGCHQFRGAWRHYYADAHGLIFVVDSSDRSRLEECSVVLEEVLSHPYISGKPILILANKQDVEGAMDDLDIVEKLEIESIVNRYKCPTRVESYSAAIKKGKKYIDPGLKKGYEWLLNYVIHHYDEIGGRIRADCKREIDFQTNSEAKNDSGIHSDNNETFDSGFENPNYGIDETAKGNGIIVVQQIHSDKNGRAVKLSPLFGTKNPQVPEAKSSIELEARTQMRKLSPIVRKKAFVASKSFENSRSSSVDSQSSANAIFARQLRDFKSQESILELEEMTDDVKSQSSLLKRDNRSYTSASSVNRITEVSLANNEIPIKFPITMEGNKKLLPPINLEAKNNTTDGIVRTTVNLFERNHENTERPKSASDIVKKQLINASSPSRNSKFSLKGLRNNRTAPEKDTNLFSFDPSANI